MVIGWLILAAAAQPSPEAVRLGRQLAESGMLSTILPMMQMKETEELIAAHPELSQNEKLELRVTSQRVYETGRDRLLEAEGRSFAKRMSVRDLRTAVAFQRSPAGKNYRAAASDAIGDVMAVAGTMDFKRDVSAAFCKETGKLCAK